MSDLEEFLLARYDEDAETLPQTGTEWALREFTEWEAKRRIVNSYDLRLSEPDEDDPIRWPGGVPLGGQAAELFYDILRLLALSYADHPDYREEWRL